VRAKTCSDVTCVIYIRKEVVVKEAIITAFICDITYSIYKENSVNIL
jgi:hypothetical protein